MSVELSNQTITYKIAHTTEDFEHGKDLFRAYLAGLNFDISFQDLEEEFAHIALKYQVPTGSLILAFDRERAIGCIGLRKLSDSIGELKRLYVDPHYRGHQIGLSLLDQSLTIAKQLGYTKVRLDTLTGMVAAIKHYQARGFYEIEAYCYNPMPNALYMEKVVA